MTRLLERAQAFRDVICDFGDLPTPHATEIREEGETGVRMQFLNLDDVIQWSIRFGTPIRFTEKSVFVKVTTTLLIEEVFVEVWAQLSPVDGYKMLQRWGYDLTSDGVEVPAAHAFSMSTLAAT